MLVTGDLRVGTQTSITSVDLKGGRITSISGLVVISSFLNGEGVVNASSSQVGRIQTYAANPSSTPQSKIVFTGDLQIDRIDMNLFGMDYNSNYK